MKKEERRRYVFAQVNSLPNAFQYVEVTQYIKDLENELKKQKEIIDKAIEYIKSIQFEENFPYMANEYQVRSALLQILEDKEV